MNLLLLSGLMGSLVTSNPAQDHQEMIKNRINEGVEYLEKHAEEGKEYFEEHWTEGKEYLVFFFNVENIDEVTQEVLNSSDTLSELMTYFK